jgi:hypothetical protein
MRNIISVTYVMVCFKWKQSMKFFSVNFWNGSIRYKTRSFFADLVFLYGGNTSYPIPPAILALGTIGNCSTWFKNTILGFSAGCMYV